MRSRRDIDERAESRFVSTGRLPSSELVPALLSLAHELYGANTEGANSEVYPALAGVPSELFGICVAGTSGSVYTAGDADVEFTLMSVSKPFVFALVCEALGPERARDTLGVNATGLPFNSLTAIERSPDGRTNPMVNPGAIATASLVPGESADAKWRLIHEGLSRFAGRPLSLDAEVYASASATNQRNQGIARLLQSYGQIACDPADATDLYTRQCCLNVSARDLAVMGATLADGGVEPRHARASGRSRDVPVHAGRDDDRGALRDVWRLALRRRAARQERDQRWGHHSLARQGWARDVRSAARRRGQQHQGAARRQVPVAAVGLDLFASEPEP